MRTLKNYWWYKMMLHSEKPYPGDPVIPEHNVGAHREARGHWGCSINAQSSLEVETIKMTII